MTTKTTERELVEEVEELLAAPDRSNRAGYALELLRRLVEEVKAHRKHLEFCFHNHVMESEITKFRDCDKCDLCEDHQ